MLVAGCWLRDFSLGAARRHQQVERGLDGLNGSTRSKFVFMLVGIASSRAFLRVCIPMSSKLNRRDWLGTMEMKKTRKARKRANALELIRGHPRHPPNPRRFSNCSKPVVANRVGTIWNADLADLRRSARMDFCCLSYWRLSLSKHLRRTFAIMLHQLFDPVKSVSSYSQNFSNSIR
jgi:hypothetical protein